MALTRLPGIVGKSIGFSKRITFLRFESALIYPVVGVNLGKLGLRSFSSGLPQSLHRFKIVLHEVAASSRTSLPGVVVKMLSPGKEQQLTTPKIQNPARTRKPSGIISPPSHKGMLELNKNTFDKDIRIPTVYVFEDSINPQSLQKFKKFMLKIPGLKPVASAGTNKSSEEEGDELNEDNGNSECGRNMKKIFINPELVKNIDLQQFVQQEIQADPNFVSSVGYETVKFAYENWTFSQIMEAVLPDDDDKVSGFSQIGHIIHLNLRDHVLPYKKLIGQVMLDKIPNAATVVNKINIIDSKYRNFQMEILGGDPNTVVTVKENRCEFEFDFATVYWNSRLCSEHDRFVKQIEPGEVLYDVFAGVGPFAVPAAKRKIVVLANDLNPDSFKWLQHNVKKNKVIDFVKCFNQDGRNFIQETASADLKERLALLQNEEAEGESKPSTTYPKRFHFVMNLPALATEFLDAFWGILSGSSENLCKKDRITILVHVYCFIKDIDGFKEKAIQLVKERLGYDLPNENVLNVVFVRNVAPNKEMLRVSFVLPVDIFIGNKCKAVKRKFCEIEDGIESTSLSK